MEKSGSHQSRGEVATAVDIASEASSWPRRLEIDFN